MIKIDNKEIVVKGELPEVSAEICLVFSIMQETLDNSEFKSFKYTLLKVIFNKYFNDSEMIEFLNICKQRYCDEK